MSNHTPEQMPGSPFLAYFPPGSITGHDSEGNYVGVIIPPSSIQHNPRTREPEFLEVQPTPESVQGLIATRIPPASELVAEAHTSVLPIEHVSNKKKGWLLGIAATSIVSLVTGLVVGQGVGYGSGKRDAEAVAKLAANLPQASATLTPNGSGEITPSHQADPSSSITPTSEATPTPTPTETETAEPKTPQQCVQENFTAAQQLGQLLILGVDGDANKPNNMGNSAKIFNQYSIGSVVVMTAPKDLYGNNATLTNFKNQQDIPMAVTVDQEGGTVQRVGWPSEGKRILSQEAFGKLSEAERKKYIKEVMQPMYEFLKKKGFDVTLGPVTDLGVKKNSPLPSRTFSTDPKDVAGLAAQYVEAATAAGLDVSPKHFPGLGEAKRNDGNNGGNTDQAPMTTPEWETIKDRSLAPYKALKGKVQYVMMGTHTVKGLEKGPAALSDVAVKLAHETIGSDVLVITDDLNTPTIVSYEKSQGVVSGIVASAVIEALKAGVDQAMVVKPNASTWETQLNGIIEKGTEAMSADDAFAQTIVERVNRVLAAKGVDPCSIS